MTKPTRAYRPCRVGADRRIPPSHGDRFLRRRAMHQGGRTVDAATADRLHRPVAGQFGMASLGPYASTKWALEGLSESLAQELRPFDIRVATVEPGVVATPMTTKPRPAIPVDHPYYSSIRRMLAYFDASLKDPTSPLEVAETVQGNCRRPQSQTTKSVGPRRRQNAALAQQQNRPAMGRFGGRERCRMGRGRQKNDRRGSQTECRLTGRRSTARAFGFRLTPVPGEHSLIKAISPPPAQAVIRFLTGAEARA
jgi:hypothetical protein